MNQETKVEKDSRMPKSLVLIVGLAVALFLSVLAGGLVHLVGRLVYIILLFPIGMAIIGFFYNATLIRQSRNRNLISGVICGLLIGMTIYGSYHFFDYLQFRSENVDAWMEADNVSGPAAIAEYEAYFDNLLVEETGQSGFIGYFVLTAQDGIEIGRSIGSNRGTNIGDIGTYIFFIVEILIVLAGAAGAVFLSGENYCEECDKWYDEELSGEIPIDKKEAALLALENGEFSELIEMLIPQEDLPYLKISTNSCATCNIPPSEVELAECTEGEDDSENEDTLFKKKYDAHETKALRIRLKSLV